MPPRVRRDRRCSAGLAVAAVLLANLLASLPAGAAEPAPADRCLDAADEAALLACRKAAHAEVTRALRQAVDQLQQRFRDDAPEHLKLFNTAQQGWRQYSQAECRFRHRESVGGAAYPATLLSCITELSKQRLQALQAVMARP
jgi:uncharacterized protein YecT (DUF1311 family)